MSKQYNKKFVNIGAMLAKKDKDEQDRPTYYIKIDDKVKVTVNGVEVKALNIQRPTDKFERMLTKGTITEAEYEQKVADFDKDGKLSFVTFEISASIDSK